MTILELLGKKIFNPAETGFLLVRHLSNHFEKELIKNYRSIPELQKNTAIFALGGFGRRELCPLSDIDIMIIYDNSCDKTEIEIGVAKLLHPLWLDGLKIGHAVRTISECSELLHTDMITLTALLDGRFLDGNRNLQLDYLNLTTTFLRINKNLQPLYQLIENFSANLEKSGGSVHLLEPNIKTSPGACRDIHFLGWLYLLVSNGRLLFDLHSSDNETQSERVLLRLYREEYIDETQYRHCYEAMDFLLKSRFALHLSGNTSVELLTFQKQDTVSNMLGFSGKTDKDITEAFMKKYYLHTRRIFRLTKTFYYRTKDFCFPPQSENSKLLDGGFLIKNHRIHLGKAANELAIESEFIKSPYLMMLAFSYQAEYELQFSDDLRGAIARSYNLITEEFQANPRVVFLFRKILLGRNCSNTLKNMLELGILNRFIPEYGPLVGLYQRNAYHRYTADYHTLVAIDMLEQASERWKPIDEIWQQLERPELLILSILFHDIGKGFNIPDHHIVGMDVAEQIMSRWGFGIDEIELVRFMIRYHLTMEQTAFRRNYHDVQTLNQFVRLFPNKEYLDILYCLTYCDLSAVAPSVWTDWKGMMLDELYRLSLSLLVSEKYDDSQQIFEKEKSNRLTELSKLNSSPAVLEHIREFGSHHDYWLTFNPEEISSHAQFRENKKRFEALVIPYDGYDEITILTHDRPGLLYQLCGVISSLDFSIFDARVFTSLDGLAVDRFRVFPLIEMNRKKEDIISLLEKRLENILFKKESVDVLIEQFVKKWKRKYQVKYLFEPEIKFEDHPDFLLVEIYAPDRLGLLYRITKSFYELGLAVDQAKIATRVDGANDTFYVSKKNLTTIYFENVKTVLTQQIYLFCKEGV